MEAQKKLRKPYIITKSRDRWSGEEHGRFLDSLLLYGRDWKKVEEYVGTKTVIQIRSHAQKYFLKAEKNGMPSYLPPPRPKRKAAHPYLQKPPSPLHDVISLEESTVCPPSDCLVPAYAAAWAPPPVTHTTYETEPTLDCFGNSGSEGALQFHDQNISWSTEASSSPWPVVEVPKQGNRHLLYPNGIYLEEPTVYPPSNCLVPANAAAWAPPPVTNTVYETEPTLNSFGNTGSKGALQFHDQNIGWSTGASSSSRPVVEVPKQGNSHPLYPDMAEVYNIIGNLVDPEWKCSLGFHLQKLKGMDPSTRKTILLLVKNLIGNLASPEFERLGRILSTYDAETKTVRVTTGMEAFESPDIWTPSSEGLLPPSFEE